ncbi:hypothetical protein [Rhodococcus tukisamuensis]|uniref:Uncharacterized protein n=1 Tax=Rhodococcus tukisamuensis TaxID=168276 RepID=A0A1G6W6F8_9NOCA|nr:hypothetical protein [Rhodococcus tukisamuensis]SDD61414.1 hypothetical protein SAMN05444580_105267 [Rhodococcus tukisamuensis]
MAKRATTRGVAATAATALAAGALALLGTGTAGAATASITWDDYYSHFTRTVSNSTPAADEVITITTKFERTNGTEEHLLNIKDRHPACLTYVPGSAKMNNTPLNPQVDDGSINGRDPLVSVDFGPNDWIVKNQPGFSPIFSVSYKVGADCTRGAALATGMDYNGSLGFGGYYTQGPAVTVSYLGGGGGAGGSIGSLFGSS